MVEIDSGTLKTATWPRQFIEAEYLTNQKEFYFRGLTVCLQGWLAEMRFILKCV
jgi:hypothetical protein